MVWPAINYLHRAHESITTRLCRPTETGGGRQPKAGPRLRESSLPDTWPAQTQCRRLIILINTWSVSRQQHTDYLSISHYFKLKFNMISDPGFRSTSAFLWRRTGILLFGPNLNLSRARNLFTASLVCSLFLFWTLLRDRFERLKEEEKERIWDGGQENASSCLRVLMSFSDNWY